MNATAAAVGTVRIRGVDLDETNRLAHEIEAWLARSGWNAHVATERLGGTSSSRCCEIEFLPGEFQSNARWHVVLATPADAGSAKAQLERWLTERS